MPDRGSILEIASGSGEHGVFFQQNFSGIVWQSSDPELAHRKSISAWIDHYDLKMKMPQPIDLDVQRRPWPLDEQLLLTLKGVVCINMIHISPWSCTKALFEALNDLLINDYFLMLYGPFTINGTHTSQSNVIFDRSLRNQNSSWGLRDLEDVKKLAFKYGFIKINVIQMPANNYSIILTRI